MTIAPAVCAATVNPSATAINLVVLRSGVHPLREIEHLVGRLRQSDVRLSGFVLNAFTPRSASYGYHKYGYAYTYKYAAHK